MEDIARNEAILRAALKDLDKITMIRNNRLVYSEHREELRSHKKWNK